MTNEKAIAIINREVAVSISERMEALEMAVDALEKIEQIKSAYESDYQVQDVIETCAEFWG